MKKSLQSSEWTLVASLILIMASLVIIAKVNAHRASTLISTKAFIEEEVLVTIEGAVSKPGEYLVSVGTALGDVLRKARPKTFANLKDISLREPVEAPMHLRIEELTEVKIFIRGAVRQPVELMVPAKTRLCDLKSKVSLTSEADRAFFRGRKWVKEGEIIEVPKKTVVVNSSD